MLSYPKCIAYGHFYKDSYGQRPNPKNLAWQQYKLDAKLHTRVQDIVIAQRLPQEITYCLMKDDKILYHYDYI
jgi:hypothetical protein